MAGNEYFCKNERRLFFLYKTRRLSQWLYMTISIDDIKDKESLEAWLNERPEAVRNNYAVFIAARSALRVMPIAVDGFQFADWSRERDLTAIAFFRYEKRRLRRAASAARRAASAAPPLPSPPSTPYGAMSGPIAWFGWIMPRLMAPVALTSRR